MNIKPIADHIVIKLISQEDKTNSGIFLPQTLEQNKPEQGKVIEVGPGKTLNSGEKAIMEVTKNDIVLFTKHGLNKIKINDIEYLIAKQEDILAILKK